MPWQSSRLLAIRIVLHRAAYNHGVDREISIIVPHSDHGDPECCGCRSRSHTAKKRTSCAMNVKPLFRTVPFAEAQRTILEMASAEICYARQQHVIHEREHQACPE